MQLGHFDFLSSQQELSTTDKASTPLAANAVCNGQAWALGFGTITLANITTKGKPAGSLFRAFAAADVAGTLTIQHSSDGQTWFTDQAASSTAVVPADFTKGVAVEAKVVLPFIRAVLTNGGTIQTECEFVTTLVSI
jgi:hypothetical protein